MLGSSSRLPVISITPCAPQLMPLTKSYRISTLVADSVHGSSYIDRHMESYRIRPMLGNLVQELYCLRGLSDIR